MDQNDLKIEIHRLDREIDAFNFVKSIVRVFSLHFMQAADRIGGWQIRELCGTGSNGVVFTVQKAEGAPLMALKIPNLSHFIMEWFDLSEAHMFDPPHEKFAVITDEILETSAAVERETKEMQSQFRTVEEEKAFKREFFSLQAIGCTGQGVQYLQDYGTFEMVLSREGNVFSRRCFSYMVTPLFQGVTLTSYFTGRAQDADRWQKAVELLGEIIDIVEHIHSRDLIHRDLHPKNFLYDETNGELNLIDFGSSFPHHDASLDMPGQRRGSKRYMSPEQFRDPGTVDERSDYFFIGGLYQFMLTGQTPFLRTRTMETLPRQPEENLTKPEGITEAVYTETLDLLHHLLCWQREDRYQSISEIRSSWQKIRRELQNAGLSDKR